MHHTIKEYYHNLATGDVTLEYSDDSTKTFSFEIMYAVDDTAVSISAPTATGFCPSTPSVVLKVNKFDL